MSQKKTECLCIVRREEGVFPVAAAAIDGDGGFSRALVSDAAAVLAAHGFPAIEDDSADWYALCWVLFRFAFGVPVGRVGSGVRP